MKQRRGLTTVVGAVFFLIAIVTAASYLTYSMNLFESFSENVFAAEQERENRQKESFDISNLTVENNKINLDIYNSGDIPVSFSRIWIENVTGVDEVYKFDLNKTIPTGITSKNILQDIPFIVVDTQSYKMKLVTERGVTKEFSLNASTDPLKLQLFALPEAVPTNFKTTLLLAVTNNSTEDTIYTNVQPVLNVISLGANATFEGINPDPFPVLEKGNTAIFEWTYRISGDDGEKVRFEASVLNDVPGNIVEKEITVQIIEFAEESGSALQSKFLTSDTAPDNILYLHKETLDSLGERQMWSSAPENNLGEIIDFNSTDAVFYTQSEANVTVNIPSGNWNSILRYISSPMPASLNHTGSSKETMAYHFEKDLNSPLDTTTNTIMTLGTGSNRPVWNSAIHQGAGAYEFQGNDYATITVNDFNDLDDSPATTTGWFDAKSSGPGSTQMIFSGTSGIGGDTYQIFLNASGYLVFAVNAGNAGQIAICTSSVNYKDDSWHHFVAIMRSDNSCELYVDGLLRDSQDQLGTSSIILTEIYLGASSNTGTNGFNGYLDDIIHWDDYALDQTGQQEVTDLFNTNYGTDAHRLNFDIRIVDEFGNDLGFSNKTIAQSFNIPITFSSDFGEYDLPVSDIWGEFNFTAITNETRVIESGERLMLNMTFVPKSIGNLNLKMIIDDIDVMSGSGSSFLEIPFPDKSLPGYTSYDNSGPGIISIFNPGPKDTWINYQSRVVFTDEVTETPYAAFITGSNSQLISPTQDSPPIFKETTTIFDFDRPRTQPGNTSSTLIPEGRYRMYVYLNGYDSSGQIFFQTNFVGVVRVT